MQPSFMGERKYLVIIPFSGETIYVAIDSSEASSPEEAEQVALLRVADTAIYGGLRLSQLGTLQGDIVVQEDTDEAREAAGITYVDYPESDPADLVA